MVHPHFKSTGQLIDNINNIAEKSYKVPAKNGLTAFIRQFYEFVPYDDLAEYSPDQLCVLSANTFKFIGERNLKAPKIRIFNPDMKKDGWESPNTVVEILNNDMPFLVDSISAEINRHGLEIYKIAHPVIKVKRDGKGKLEEYAPKGDAQTESVIHLQISHLADDKIMAQLEDDLLQMLKAVKLSVDDWKSMLKKANYVITEISASCDSLKQGYKPSEITQINDNAFETKEFLEWLKSGNFVFMGYVEYAVERSVKLVKGSELGIAKLYEPEVPPTISIKNLDNPLLGKNHKLLEIIKANRKSVVHRPAHMDYISIKRINDDGKIVGEHRFLGLFTSMVYYQSASKIPVLRKKMDSIRERSRFSPDSHNGKALISVLEDFPRDELLQSSEEKLFETALGIVLTTAQAKVKLFIRKDDLERFISCIILIPRDLMSTELRRKIEKILMEAFNGTVSNHYTQVTESSFARLQIIIKTTPGKIPAYNLPKIEKDLAVVARRWVDGMLEEFQKRFGEKKGREFYGKYENIFSLSYQSRFSSEDAYYDVLQIEKVLKTGNITFDIYESSEGTENIFEFKVFNPDEQISLSRIMPILENMGLHVVDEHTYLARKVENGTSIWIHRFRFMVVGMKKPKLFDIKKNFEEAIYKIWIGEVQNDGLNKLILLANLKWRDVVLVRTYSKYLQQSGFSYSQAYIQEALGNHPKLVQIIIDLFYSCFDPDFKGNREKRKKELLASVENILGKVSNLAEDRVIRGFADLILATLRTNAFQKDADGNLKNYISFKLKSSAISWLPEPKPYAEIFVYSARVEGIHLRGGKVARGGLRWSDRREDFRTEVLGLMKAQMTKNSVIIPVGSKGGFVVKKPPVVGGREAFLQEGIECYKIFLRGLLDVTDNIVKGKIVAPANVVRQDGDDPYLVVAADKGTATFSDIANSISEEYGFWLGDAFASGGSAGYDHKKMGITAKGAWISVKRHFAEMGIDVDKEDFSVIGIGDMAGDVFGNGMLLSKHIKLVGAFNHLHIFLDPNPDAAKSFHERQRLFNLPRSSWMDYNSELISKGGGVFERSAKTIKLSKEICKVLGITQNSLTPDELIKQMLMANVDLLWNGGIGTYVKAASETHGDVGDRANDVLRVNGSKLRAKVAGEGGNLGFTQLGRIEYAMNGGRINTDAIDNSAGVDCSDHEVNIKIALGDAVASGKLTLNARNKLLESMTDEVAGLVLRDNTLQTQALTFAQLQAHSLLETQERFISSLEKEGYLNREVEFLPGKDEITKRHAIGKGLTRPELSVLLAYGKIALYDDLLKSNIPDDPYYRDDLIKYFPVAIQDKFVHEIEKHPLRREIITASITNSIINRIGNSLFYHMQEDASASSCDVARAYTVVRDAFELRGLWDDISAVKHIKPEDQKDLFLEVQNIVERTSLWFLRHYPQPIVINDAVKAFAPGIKELSECLTYIMSPVLATVFETRLKKYTGYGVPAQLAKKIAGLEAMSSGCDIVQVAKQAKLSVDIVGKTYFELGSRLNLGWMRRALDAMPHNSYWQRSSYKTLIDELFDQQRRLTSEVIKHLCNDKTCSNATETWIEHNKKQVERYDLFMNDLLAQEEPDFSMIVVAIRKVRELSGN